MPTGNRALGVLFAFALALAALTKDRAGAAGSATTGDTASKGAPVATAQAAGAGSEKRASPAPPPDECRHGDVLMQEYARLHHPTRPASALHYVVALVPDPEESGHTDYFDAVLEGVEEAALAGSVDLEETAQPSPLRRYVRDRHWLPWSKSDKAKRESKCWERVPGVILYRPSEGAGQHPGLAVLVVGETPTWGVRANVLEAALERADLASCASGGGKAALSQHWHRILGPTFSGTAPSLRAVIDRHTHLARARGDGQLPVTFRIASGTATGGGVMGTLQDGHDAVEASVTYQSAVPTFDRLLNTMVAFLDSADGGASGDGSRSAVLSESGTAYGEQSDQDADSGVEHRSATRILHYRFPPNLISLRKAYEAAPATGVNGEPAITRAPSSTNLAPDEARGELSEQSVIAHDLALAEVLNDCGRQQVRNVGIVATDARDVIFIAKQVSQQLPDVRLFTIGDDIRYLHPDHVRVMNGMLVAHAAPPLFEGWSSTVTKNPMTQHVAAAGQFLLAKQALAPLARVSLIGNGSLRQMAGDIDAQGQERTFAPEAPRSFGMVCLLTLFVLIIVLLLVVGPQLAAVLSRPGRYNLLPEDVRTSPFLRQRSALWSWLHQIDCKDLAADDKFATAALVSVVACALLMTSSTLIRASALPPSAQYVLPVLLGVLLIVVWRPCWSARKEASRSAIWLGTLMGGVAFIATSLGCSPPREATLWLLSGASPLIGGLVGMSMLLVVAWCWRARLRSLDLLCFGAKRGDCFAGFVDAPPLAQLLGYRKGESKREIVRKYEQSFLSILRSPWGTAPLIVVSLNAALIGSIVFVHFLKPVLTFEPGFRHWVLFGVVVACVLPITTCCARMIVTSRALLGLLRAVASPDLLAAFEHLPSELTQRLETQLVRAGRHSGELRHPVQALRELARVEPTSKAPAQNCAELLDGQLRYEAGLPAIDNRVCPADLVDELLGEANRLSNQTQFHLPQGPALADRFRACLTAILVGRYVREMRSLIPPVVLGCTLGILMTSLYFVQPRHLIATACFMWVTVIVLAIIAIYIQLARDPLLSAIGKTDAGEVNLNWGLATRVGAVTIVPLAGLIASQYPEFAFWVTSLLGNVTQFVQ